MNELSTETTGRELAHTPAPSANLLSQIIEAARDPAVDAGKMEAMANLAMKLQDRELQAQFNSDLALAIMEMPRISKRGIIIIPANRDKGTPERQQGKFAKFEDLDRVVSPILARHNMVIRFELGSDQGTTARPIIMHTNGVTDRGDALRLPPDTSGSKNAAQAVGSSSSYAKRYAMCAALNIVTEDEDDDGRGGALPDDPPNDRQQRLIKHAEEAVATGTYEGWFGEQPVKDRAWLLDTGRHAAFGGGQVTLPPPEAKKAPPAPQQDDPGTEPPPTEKKRQTAEEWFADYKRQVNDAEDRGELEAVKTRARNGLAKLKDGHPTLYAQLEDLHAIALDRVSRNDEALEEEDQAND